MNDVSEVSIDISNIGSSVIPGTPEYRKGSGTDAHPTKEDIERRRNSIEERARKSRKKKIIFFTVLGVIILIELAIGLSVILTQCIMREADYQAQLVVLTNRTILSIANVIQIFQYSVIRTGAAIFELSPDTYVGDEYFNNILQLNFSRPGSAYNLYFWVSRILNSERQVFEDFGKENITPKFEILKLDTNSTKPFDPNLPPFLERDDNRSVYFPFTVLAPITAIPQLYGLVGLNVDSVSSLRMLIPFLTDIFIFVAIDVPGVPNKSNSAILLGSTVYYPDNSVRGYNFGYTDLASIVDASVKVDRDDVWVICLDVTANISSKMSLILKDNVDIFYGIDSAADFYNSNLNKTYQPVYLRIVDKRFAFYFIYNDRLRESLESKTVIILSIVMILLFVILDLTFIFFYIRLFQLSELRMLEKEALDQANHLKILEQQKTDLSNKMLGYVNHELRNPLQGIMGLAEIIYSEINRLDMPNDEMKEKKIMLRNKTSTLIKQTEFMKHIIDDILDIRKLEENMVDINVEMISVESILKSTYKSIKSKIQEKKGIVEFGIFINDEVFSLINASESEENEIKNDVYIESDIFRIQQILLNLLTNALKYTNHGYVHLKVLTSDEEPEKVTFAVFDTGRGIPKDKWNVIFTPFSQANTTDASRYGGIGLGLYLCKMLVHLLHGEIGFESEFETDDAGSKFWITLPKKFPGQIYENTVNNTIF